MGWIMKSKFMKLMIIMVVIVMCLAVTSSSVCASHYVQKQEQWDYSKPTWAWWWNYNGNQVSQWTTINWPYPIYGIRSEQSNHYWTIGSTDYKRTYYIWYWYDQATNAWVG